MTTKGGGEERYGVRLSSLDSEAFDGAGVTKRELVDYVEAMCGPLVTALHDRPLSVIRVRPGQPKFMQKNLPGYTPDWVPRVTVWAEASKRDIDYALGNDLRTLLWLANQRVVEFHVTLFRMPVADSDMDGDESADKPPVPEFLVLDLDPPEGAEFRTVVQAAYLVRDALASAGLTGAVKTSGAKGVHVFVPLAPASWADVAAATRAVASRAERIDPALATTAFVKDDRGGKVFLDSTRAGGATVVAAYSPRARPGLPVSFPVPWEDLDSVTPGDFTVRTVPGIVGGADPWQAALPSPQELNADLVAEGHEIPIARVAAMHEGKRRARARRDR